MASRSFIGSVAGVLGDIGRAHRAHAAYDRLSRMNDVELSRRGLARADIARAAFREGFGEV